MDTDEDPQTAWNSGRRLSEDVLSVSGDRRPTAVGRLQQKQVPGRVRAPPRTPRLPPVIQMNQRRTSQPTPAQARQPLPGDITRQSSRRFSDNGAKASCRERRYDAETYVQMTAFGRRQSVQSNPATTVRDQCVAPRRSSEGRGVAQVDTWWTRSAHRQTEPPDRQAPLSTHYRKRRSAPEVACTRPYRRESTGSSGRQTTGDSSREHRGEMAGRRRRLNTAAAMRLADESFDSVLTSALPSPTESIGSDFSSTPSLSDIARGPRKDSGFRSIDTQSSHGASRKNSAGGLRRQSFQATDVDAGRHHSIPFVANPFEFPGRSSCRPASAGPRSSGRRQSMFTRSDEVGGGDVDWLNEWLRWRTGCVDDIELPEIGRHAASGARGAGVWNSLSEKVERTLEGFDRVIHRAAALVHDRRMSSDSDNHIEC